MSRSVGQVGGWTLLSVFLAAVAVMSAFVGLCALLRPPVLPVAGLGESAGEAPADQAQTGPEAACDEPPERPQDTVSSLEVVTCPDRYDGVRVTFVGEVVGAVLQRGDRAWVQLNDDPYSRIGPLPQHRVLAGANAGLAVSIPIEAAQAIRFVGSARAAGDVLAVEGAFLRADPADGGGPAIQATSVEVVRTGRRLQQPTDPWRVLAAALAVAAAAALTVRARRARASALGLR